MIYAARVVHKKPLTVLCIYDVYKEANIGKDSSW